MTKVQRIIAKVAATIFAGATAFNMGVAVQDIIHDHSEPQGVYVDTTTAPWDVDTESDKPAPEEDEPGWDCTTMGNGICGTDAFPLPPKDENGEYVTNPCPYEAQMEGYCEGGW